MERSAKYLKNLVGAPRFELGTSCAQGRRATRLRYAPTVTALFILKHFPTLVLIRPSFLRSTVHELCTNGWGEPLEWHSFFGHSFRFPKNVLASPSRRRGLGKGTAFESLSPAVL
jgi:hypothetical protein